MPTAREIKTKLRRQDNERRRQREEAVVAVALAAAAVAKARESRQQRIAESRRRLEAAVAAAQGRWDGRVNATEVDAGRAVLAAMDLGIRHADLGELAECSVADLRKWAQLARQTAATGEAAEDSVPAAAGADDGAGQLAEPVRPDPEPAVTGLAVTRPRRADEATD